MPKDKLRPASPARIDGKLQSDAFDGRPLRDDGLYLLLALYPELACADTSLDLDGINQLIAVRNVFAFLTGQSLVATLKSLSIFNIFLRISDIFHRYEFSNLDGSILGKYIILNFEEYITNFRISDVTASREKIIEAIILGERIRS